MSGKVQCAPVVKKGLSCLLVLFLLFHSVAVSGEGAEEYTPAQAFAMAIGGQASWAAGNTVTLEDAVSYGSTVPVTEEIVLQLNDYAVSFSGSGAALAIEAGRLTIEGGGSITATDQVFSLTQETDSASELSINAGSYSARTVLLIKGGNATILAGTFAGAGEQSRAVSLQGGSLTIAGGSFTGETPFVNETTTGNALLSGGTFTGIGDSPRYQSTVTPLAACLAADFAVFSGGGPVPVTPGTEYRSDFEIASNPLTALTLKTPSAMTTGDLLTLTTNVPEEYRPFIAWESGNRAVVAFDESGRAKALKAGTSVITAKFAGFEAASTVTVKNLAVPSGVKAVKKSDTSIQITWKKINAATGYRLYRATSKNGTYQKIKETTALSHTDQKLTTGRSYYYKVTAVRQQSGIQTESGVSAASGGVNLRLQKPGIPKVTNLDTRTIRVTWSKTPNASGYYVYRATKKDGIYYKAATVPQNSYTDTKVIKGKTYYYKIQAYGRAGNYLSPLTDSRLGVAKLAKPKNLSAKKVSGNSISVSWDKSKNAVGYYVYRCIYRNGTYQKVATVNKNSFTDKGRRTGRSYYYKVIAYDTEGIGNSFMSEASPGVKLVLQTPTGVSAKALSPTSIQVQWKAVQYANGYYVYRSEKSNGTYKKIAALKGTSFQNKKCSYGQTYYYKIAAWSNQEKGTYDSAKSGRVSAKPAFVKPVLSAKLAQGGVTLSWGAVSGAQKYLIYRKTVGGAYQKVKETTGKSYLDTTGKKGQTYTYRIRAYAKVDGKHVYSSYSNTKQMQFSRIDPKKPMIALTFDDGPASYTTAIVDQLNKYNGRATFFVVGSRVDSYSKELSYAYRSGNEIGNHTYSHPMLSSLSAAGIQSEIYRTNQKVRNITNETPKVMRPPYGDSNSFVSNQVGMPQIFWSVDTLDWKTQSAQSTIQSILGARDGDIVLMHDIHPSTKDAAIYAIAELSRRGYQLVTVSELAYYKGETMKAGGRYHSFR